MSKSLEFCKELASNSNRSSYSDRDWSKAIENMDTEAYFDKILNGQRQVIVTEKDYKNNDFELQVKFCFDKQMQPPHNSDTIEYTIGNFIILNEYNNKSFSNDNPHLCSRTTVLLPLKYKIKEKNWG